MKRVLGILAHVDAGKTTFSEQLLYHTQTIRKPGRVDHQDAFMDSHPIERARGITIFSDQAVFKLGTETCYLVDTPGHVDFSSETERAIQIMDMAVIIVSAAEGVQSHTETLWKLLRRYSVPTLLFINKIDRQGADVNAVLASLGKKCSPDCVRFDGHFKKETMDDTLAEAFAERDETLLEQYLASGYKKDVFANIGRKLFFKGSVFPVLTGSALNDEGIDTFLDVLKWLTTGEDQEEASKPFAAKVYKICHDTANNRLSFLKITAGTLRVKEEIATGRDSEGKEIKQKVNEIRLYSGTRHTSVQTVKMGELCAVTNLMGIRPGDGIGSGLYRAEYATTPLLTAKVLYDKSLNIRTVLAAFRELEDEDPMLQVVWNEGLQSLQIHIMGAIQLEVLGEITKERFGLAVSFGESEVLYKETIAAPVIGYGHFEPLRHYAEVHLRLTPTKRGSGIRFKNDCSVDILDTNFQNLIKTHVFEREHKGVLTGSPITDMEIAVVNGRAHLKHTEGGDFREATYRAIRQGLEQAHSVLLEPVYAFEIEVPADALGRVMSDIQKMSGRFDPPEMDTETAVITGHCPVAQMMAYSQTLIAFTAGRGILRTTFAGYEPCHNTQAVIEQCAYDKKHDTENTSDSVFCSHGAGYTVPWNEVEALVHCK